MYPYVRQVKSMIRASRMPKIGLLETHVSHHICWPWDIDPWMELNNGRTLTLYDLGRIELSIRTGLIGVLRKNRWGIVVAGNTTRYRRRVTSFQSFEMRTRCIGWDHRFVYMEQGMYRNGECSSHILVRGAVTSRNKMLEPQKVLAELDHTAPSPVLPQWVQGWIDTDATRPWPPTL
ncbi:acyl-CoA thioesterase [Albirhodobacter sp. R86504]|jgi:acyl-CoA thioesterase FadM|uniref:acyl-CoA thioesterase n=1 Tax=Albirhodobacter sp. R86504 TaxID=3093848 RepID=UPI00366CAB85